MNNGYLQAIENMAYEVNKLTDETLVRLHLEGIDPADAIDSLLPGELAQWGELEMIARTITETYGKPPQQVQGDVWMKLLENEGLTLQ